MIENWVASIESFRSTELRPWIHRQRVISSRQVPLKTQWCRGSRVVKVSDRDWPCHEFKPSTIKDPRVEERCTLNLSRAATSYHWCGVAVRRGGTSSGVDHVT
ncbi:hypothetical protein TNCV_3403091 [Trichonephila clavipes]|nr:hypothetical protein TNCV_3403091 [Trichonephila clavipes]